MDSRAICLVSLLIRSRKHALVFWNENSKTAISRNRSNDAAPAILRLSEKAFVREIHNYVI